MQKLKAGRVECRVCPPEPDSRSNRARKDDPHLLYLVRYRGLKKFGRGYEGRVKAHQNAGAEVVQSAIEHHTVRLSATGISIDVGQGGVSHRAPGTRYSTSIDVSGPVAAAELSIGAFGPDASCSVEVDGVSMSNNQVQPGDRLILVFCKAAS